MIASMFNLDHRLAELRPTESELRIARERRDANQVSRLARTAGRTARRLLDASNAGSQSSRLAAG
ncbi:MAG TPA: hypothetical protein VFP56_01460 [Candidatus Limnocylindrales bacterium]|nr:hypothetical protein [Candidatus Limnocylindrales bacterium]